jgi:signal transduction histidine kinase
MFSIHSPLWVTSWASALGAGVLLLGLSPLLGQRHTQDLLDTHLTQLGRLLSATTLHEIAEQDLPKFQQDVEELHLDDSVAYQVWSHHGEPLLRSPNAAPLPAPKGSLGRGEDLQLRGERWRVLTHVDGRLGYPVQVARRYEDADRPADPILKQVLPPVLGTAFVLGGVLLLLWERRRRAIERLALALRQADPHQPDPVSAADLPGELRPLLAEVNALLERARAESAHRHRASADIAHELRGPLAAIRTQAQVGLRVLQDRAGRRVLDKVLAGIDRASHQVDRVLALARLERGEAPLTMAPQDIYHLAKTELTGLLREGVARGVMLELSGEAGVSVAGNAELLSLLLRNLLLNAVANSPAGGKVSVHVVYGTGSALITVEDCGPGIPGAERGRVFEPFYRLPGSPAGGSGLGLALVRRIADLHHASITLTPGVTGSGLSVKVRFPRPAAH